MSMKINQYNYRGEDMSDELNIERILEFIEKNNYSFSFKGNKKDVNKGFSTLFNYQENTMTFVSSLNRFSDYTDLFDSKEIQLIIIDPSEIIDDSFINVIQIEKPKNAFFSILDQFFDEDSTEDINPVTTERQSHISESAIIGRNVKIGIGCVIEVNVYIGDSTVIHHNVVIKSNTEIGKNCTIFSGTVIGERGFSPFTKNDGSRNMLKHYGGVTIEDDVHIGDNCCIIRGAIDDTIIKKGTKLNTMVHIAHNCIVGENTVITMPTHISGSVSIGDNCHIAAIVIRNQCNVGDGAVLGLGAVVVKDVPA